MDDFVTPGRSGTTPIIHVLKTWPAYFNAVMDGEKNFEVRRADRNFQVGDTLRLVEWSQQTGHTGRALDRRVTYLLPGGEFGIEGGYCVMGLGL